MAIGGSALYTELYHATCLTILVHGAMKQVSYDDEEEEEEVVVVVDT